MGPVVTSGQAMPYLQQTMLPGFGVPDSIRENITDQKEKENACWDLSQNYAACLLLLLKQRETVSCEARLVFTFYECAITGRGLEERIILASAAGGRRRKRFNSRTHVDTLVTLMSEPLESMSMKEAHQPQLVLPTFEQLFSSSTCCPLNSIWWNDEGIELTTKFRKNWNVPLTVLPQEFLPFVPLSTDTWV